HEVYSVVGTPSARKLSETHAPTGGQSGLRYWLRGVGPLGLRRSALVVAPLVLLLLIGTGVAARAVFDKPAPPAVQTAAKTASVPAPKPAVVEEKQAPVAEKPAPAPKVVANVDKKPEKAK